MNALKIRFSGLSVICIITFFALNGIAQQQQWRSWQDSIGNNEQIAPMYGDEQIMTLDGAGNSWLLYELNVRPVQYGIAKFDGTSWTHFDSTSGLMGGQLYGIIRDHNGNIWVSGDSGIATYSQGSWHTYAFQDQHTGLRIYGSLAADSSGNIWVASGVRVYYYSRLGLTGNLSGLPIMNTIDTLVSEVFRFDGKNWTPFPMDISLFHLGNWYGINSITVGSTGVVWVAGNQPDSIENVPFEGLWRLDGNSWSTFDLDDGNGTAQNGTGTPLHPIAVHPDSKGGAWVAYASVLDNKNYGISYPPAVNYFNGSVWVPSSLTGARFSDVWLDPNGDKYFKSSLTNSDTSKGGLVFVDATDNVIDSINKNDIPYFPYHLDFAANGSIWMGSEYHGPIIETLSTASGVATVPNLQSIASAYPNPATNLLNIENFVGNIFILDPLGRSYEVHRNANTLDISPLPPGVYFVSDGRSRAKFVKE